MTMEKLKWLNLFMWMILRTIEYSNGSPHRGVTLASYLSKKVVLIENTQDPKSPSTLEPIFLNELYGENIRIRDFNPGKQIINMINEANAMKIFPLLQLSKRPFISNTRGIQEFSHIYKTIEYSLTLKKPSLLTILGGPKSGKTCSLRYIYEKSFTENNPTFFNLFINLPQVLETIAKNDDAPLEINDILIATVPKPTIDLILNVRSVCPSKIRVFLDDVDRVAPKMTQKVANFIALLHRSRISVMATHTDPNFISKIPNLPKDVATFNIPDQLTPEDVSKYLAEYWIKEYRANGINLHKNLVQKYVRAFNIMTAELNFPCTVGMVRYMADFFMYTIPQDSFLSITQYAQDNSLFNPHALRDMIISSDNFNFPKMHFYDGYFGDLTLEDLEIYGIEALAMIGTSHSTDTITELKPMLAHARETIKQKGHYRWRHIIYNRETNLPMRFDHEDYKNYFAAKYILNDISSDMKLQETWKVMLLNIQYNYVLEYINSAILTDENKKSVITYMLKSIWERDVSVGGILTEESRLFLILDNFIQLKMDGLCSVLFNIIDGNYLTSYLNTAIILKSKNKYALGLMVSDCYPSANSIKSLDYIPRKTIFMVSGRRPEMLVNLQMENTIKATERVGFMWDGSHFLGFCAKRSIKCLNNVISQLGSGPYSVEVLNRAMFEAVNSLGRQSVPIVAILRKLGGVPKKVSVDGRTLAHAAVQWHDVDLLRTVHEEFHVGLLDKPDHFGRTILFTALDANPFLAYTREGFWSMMKYLVKKADLSINIELMKLNMPAPIPSTHIFQSQLLLLTGTPDCAECKSAAETMDLVDLHDWDLPLNLKSLRRNRIIRNCKFDLITDYIPEFVTLSELILTHRGVGRLSTVSQLAYEDTVMQLLTKELAKSNRYQIKRILTDIMRNIDSHDGFARIWTRIHDFVDQSFTPVYTAVAREIFGMWVDRTTYLAQKILVAENQILLTNYDLTHNLVVQPSTSTNKLRHYGGIHYEDCVF